MNNVLVREKRERERGASACIKKRRQAFAPAPVEATPRDSILPGPCPPPSQPHEWYRSPVMGETGKQGRGIERVSERGGMEPMREGRGEKETLHVYAIIMRRQLSPWARLNGVSFVSAVV